MPWKLFWNNENRINGQYQTKNDLIADIDSTVPENNPRDLEKTDKYDQILTDTTHTLHKL
jgi:hypothetical protein